MSKTFTSDRLPDYFQPTAKALESYAEQNDLVLRIKFRTTTLKDIVKIKFLSSVSSVICTKEHAKDYVNVIVKYDNQQLEDKEFVVHVSKQQEYLKEVVLDSAMCAMTTA